MSIDSNFGTPQDFDDTSRKSPETLEQEIDAQRSSIGHLVDALEKKVSPGQLIDQALAYAKDNGAEFFGNLGTTLKANPVPVVLTSVGMLWLMMGSRTPSSTPSMLDHVGERVSDVAGHVSDSLSNAKNRLEETASRMKDKAGHLTEQIGETLSSSPAHDTGRILHEKGLRLQSGANTLLSEQPLVVAAIGIALGALIGAALPASEREKQWIGQARNKLVAMAPQETENENSPADLVNDNETGLKKADNPQARFEPSPGTSPGLG